jgi:ketosteroid isomerase-like protein
MKKLDNQEFRRIVDGLNKRYDDCLNNKTPELYPDLVTSQYVWVDETKPITVRGKEGVRALGTEWVAAGATNEAITALEVENYGNSGWQIAEITIDFPNEQGVVVPTKGRFVEIFEKEDDGQWRTRLQFFVPFR